jgi:hypothetical protein
LAMEERNPKIAEICPAGQAALGTMVWLSKEGLFLPYRPDAGALHSANAFSSEEIEILARFFGHSAEETAKFLNHAPELANWDAGADTDQDTRSELGKAVRCGRYELSIPDGVGPEATNALDEEELEEVVGFFQAALGSVGGRIGGRSRSKAKIIAARENGKKGGRPKGSNHRLEREREGKQRNAMQDRIEVRRIE